MLNRRFGATTVVIAVLLMVPAHGAGPTFVPDAVFKGANLTGWHTLGAASWRAENGEIVGSAQGGAGGWLVLDKPYQDVGVYASIRCAAGCQAGVLLRAEKTPQGTKGIFLSLGEKDIVPYRVTLDAQGKELQRERLRSMGGMVRIAPPPPPESAAAGRGGGGGGARRGTVNGPFEPPAGMKWPLQASSGDLRAGDFNRIEIFLDANIVRWFINDGTVSGAVADNDAGSFGPIALYAGGTGEARFREVSYKDLGLKASPTEQVSDRFKIQRLTEFYYSWSAAAADFNRDGVMDVATGPYVYFGPDFTSSREVYLAQPYNPAREYPYSPSRQIPSILPDSSWVVHAGDFTGDGWPDVLTTDHSGGTGAILYVNPKGEPRRWDKVTVVPVLNSEITLMRDVDGDGRLELVYGGEAQVRYAQPDPANPTGPWTVHNISEPGPWFGGAPGSGGHGIGVGDIDGDGRMDVVTAWGWWQQPASGGTRQTWAYHPETFGRWERSLPGGGTTAIYDVNGDGRNDVVAALAAHGLGLAWFEQKRDAGGKISFAQHMIMDDFSTTNAGGVTFSELHGATTADIDGDGVLDFIVGKRYWAHQDNYYDPDPYGAAVLYWYRTVRNPKAPGGAEFVPNLIHNRSGVGSDVLATDLNKDGAIDIVTSTNRGTFVFWGIAGGARPSAQFGR